MEHGHGVWSLLEYVTTTVSACGMLGIPKLYGAVEHDNVDQVVLPVHRQADLRALTRKATR